jgi:hypothetical protein
MKSNYTRIIANLVFAGAVATGAFLPLGSPLAAAGLSPHQMSAYSRYLPGMIQERIVSAGSESGNPFLSVASAAPEALPTIEEYLGKLVCSGCERRCPLTALKCSRGRAYLEKATSAYRAMVAEKSSVPANNAFLEKTPAVQPVQAIAPVVPTGVQGEKKAGVVETTMEYLPLAGLVVGGVYFAVGNRKKINK